MKKKILVIVSIIVAAIALLGIIWMFYQRSQRSNREGEMGYYWESKFQDYYFVPMESSMPLTYDEGDKSYYVENYIQYSDEVPSYIDYAVMYQINLTPPHQKLDTYTKVIEQAKYYFTMDPVAYHAGYLLETYIPFKMYHSDEHGYWVVVFVDKVYQQDKNVGSTKPPLVWLIAMSQEDGKLIYSGNQYLR